MNRAEIELSVVIVARNAAELLDACLASVRDADEIIVVDDASFDDTDSVAASRGARVLSSAGRLGALRGLGLERCRGDWVLSLDADERLPPGGVAALRRQIRQAHPGVVAFRLPIRTHLGDRFLRWGGYYPARRVRLFRNQPCCRWLAQARVHERLEFGGQVRRCRVAIDHLSYANLEQARQKNLRYARWSALELREQGHRPSICEGAVRAIWRFVRSYAMRGGFLMGSDGWSLASLQAQGVWYRTLWAQNAEKMKKNLRT